VVWNKVDLLPDKAAAVAIASATAPATALVTLLATTTEAVRVSATTGAGLAELRAVVGTRLGLTTADAPGTFSARARHVEALERAEQCVLAAVQTNAQDVGAELVAEDLRLAQMALEEVTGRVLPDEVLAAVFSRFCIGK
jgi:tRNA modification GTPase